MEYFLICFVMFTRNLLYHFVSNQSRDSTDFHNNKKIHRLDFSKIQFGIVLLLLFNLELIHCIIDHLVDDVAHINKYLITYNYWNIEPEKIKVDCFHTNISIILCCFLENEPLWKNPQHFPKFARVFILELLDEVS